MDIKSAIPHRPPFLLVDEVKEINEESILCQTTLRAEDELWSRVYAGHYPGNPITPGVLLCEIVFQAAAILMSERVKKEGRTGVPVLTRIGGAKFKGMVKPGDIIEISAELKEQVSNAFYMTGSIKNNGKLAVKVDYTVALVEE
ncbi:MAG: beta-hydroxyacyl-ACP dehydratase [Planctomycetes bacterium]|nr:beta-hydroxyacyl-ACP dehydratase [Planctomycetota bacterium]